MRFMSTEARKEVVHTETGETKKGKVEYKGTHPWTEEIIYKLAKNMTHTSRKKLQKDFLFLNSTELNGDGNRNGNCSERPNRGDKKRCFNSRFLATL